MPQKMHGPRDVAATIDNIKPEFDQSGAADYACNGSGQISPRTIRRATESGELRAMKVGHKWLYSRASIDAWLAAKGGAR